MKTIALVLVAGLLATSNAAGTNARPASKQSPDISTPSIAGHRFSATADRGSRAGAARTTRPAAPRRGTARPVSDMVPMAPPGAPPGSPEIKAPADSSGPIPYTRSLVDSDYTNFPTSTNGRVIATFPGGPARLCSGTVVHSGAENRISVVFTAARCVYREALDGWAETVEFQPAYRAGSAPFGTWSVSEAFVPSEWIQESENQHFDVAALQIPPTETRGSLEKNHTGGLGLRWNLEPASRTLDGAFGYPSTAPFTGDLLYKCSSAAAQRDTLPQPPGDGPPVLSIGCDLTQEGTAGGGWVVNDVANRDLYLLSVFSHKIPGESEVAFGPYFGDLVDDLYRAAIVARHRMKLSFKLKGRLVAFGRIRARDGYGPCGNNAPIRIQRKRDGKWRTVKKTRSKASGKYKVRIRNRRGLYRAFSPAGFVDVHRCSSAKSRTRRNR